MRSGVKFGAPAAPNGEEEARALFLTWEEIGPLMAYALEGDWQAVVAMRHLLQDLSSETPARSDLRAAEVVQACGLRCYKAACQSNYLLLYSEDGMTTVVCNAVRLGVGFDMVCADVVESLNDIHQRSYNDHTARNAGGNIIRTGRGDGVARLGVVVFEILPSTPALRDPPYGPAHHGQIDGHPKPPPSTFASPPPAPILPPCGLHLDVKHAKAKEEHLVCWVCVCACFRLCYFLSFR